MHSRRLATAALATALLSLTGAAAARSLRQYNPACICTNEYDPVCGVTNTTDTDDQPKAFPNDCNASCANAKILYPGECEPCICPAIFKPVCATNLFGVRKTYSNDCAAGCVNATVISQGECPKAAPAPTRSCICTREYAPVCGADGKTYGNKCEANCAGVTYTPGECETGGARRLLQSPTAGSECICTEEYEPVCGANNQTYGNACLAGCENVTVVSQGDCPNPVVGVGEACGGFRIGPIPVCEEGLTCKSDPRIPDLPGVCALVVGEGESCGGFRRPPRPECDWGFYCKYPPNVADAPGVCTVLEPAGEGEACGGFPPVETVPLDCAEGLTCKLNETEPDRPGVCGKE